LPSAKQTAAGVVALFNASDDTIDMIEGLLKEARSGQTLVWCHFSDLKKGKVDFARYLGEHNPEVVIFDLSPPYAPNWQFYMTMRDSEGMRGRGAVLTTTNKNRLDDVLGTDSLALELAGEPADLQQIGMAIAAATRKAHTSRLTLR
jgi:hypothetical protein